jgi:hypothetical protein
MNKNSKRRFVAASKAGLNKYVPRARKGHKGKVSCLTYGGKVLAIGE